MVLINLHYRKTQKSENVKIKKENPTLVPSNILFPKEPLRHFHSTSLLRAWNDFNSALQQPMETVPPLTLEGKVLGFYVLAHKGTLSSTQLLCKDLF